MKSNEQALDLLRVHEGYRQFPYADSLGIQTIGLRAQPGVTWDL